MRPSALFAAPGRPGFLKRRLRTFWIASTGIAVVSVLALLVTGCRGGSSGASGSKSNATNGGAQLQVTGKVAGAVVISGPINCATDGASSFIAGNVATLPVSLSVGRTKAGQTYTFPQAAGTLGAFVTFASTGATSSTWIAGSDDQPGKGTVTLTATGGSLDLDLVSAATADGTEHVSGTWTCGT
jgi:hypothetical protein